MRDFTKLAVWARAHRWALDLHGVSQNFPSSERYELGQQLRRAAFAVPTNIAEGAGHSSDAQFARYLSIAAASASEAEYLTMACRDLGYIEAAAANRLDQESRSIRKMVFRFIESLPPARSQQRGPRESSSAAERP